MSDKDKLVNNPTTFSPPSYSASTSQQGAPPPYTPTASPPYPPAGDPSTNYQYQSFDSVVANQVEVVSVIRLGPVSALVQCPSCGQFGMTCLSYKPGVLTCISAMICFFFCVICTFLPFCIQDLQDVSHHCPACGYHIGTYSRI